MLNLAQVNIQVKKMNTDPATMCLSHRSAAGMNEAYRQLKALGWECVDNEIHPRDRVPVFRFGDAAIRRDKASAYGWIVWIGGEEWDAEGSLADITGHARQLLAEPPP